MSLPAAPPVARPDQPAGGLGLFRIQALLTLLLWAAWVLLPPVPQGKWLLLSVAMLVVGIPHGANDLQLLALHRPGWSAFRRFIVYGLAVVAAMAAMLTWPLAGLLVFLLLTAFHFGQGEMLIGSATSLGLRAVALAYGAVLLLALLAPHAAALPAYLPATPGFARLVQLFARLPASPLPYVGAAAALLTVAVAAERFQSEGVVRKLAVLLGLLVLFARTDLVFAFSVYFGIWHSPDSIRLFSGRLYGGGGWRAVRRFYVAALPITGLALGLLAGAGWFNARAGLAYPLPFVLLTFIFAVTVPHVLVTEPIYREPEA